MKRYIPFLFLLFFVSCNEGTSSSSGETVAAENSTGTLVLGEVTGIVLPKEGADASSVAGASISAIGRPDIVGETDAEGHYKLSNIAPGTLAVVVTSNDTSATALADDGTAKFGVKIDDVVVISGKSTDLGETVFKETGSITGTVNYFDNPDNADLIGVEVFVPGSSYIAKTDKDGKFTLSGLPEGTYDIRVQQEGFSKLDLEKVEVIEAQQTDMGTLMLSLSRGPEGGISLAGDLKNTIGGIEYPISLERSVVANISYDSDASLMKVADEPSFLNKKWIPVEKTVPWTFEGDGKKTLYVQFSDLNGLESSPFSVDFYVDTEAPALTDAVLVNGWNQIGTRDSFLDITASDSGSGIAQVMFSNNSIAFNSGEVWQNYTGSHMDWTLADGADGLRTVYLKVRDYAGRESTVVSDDITKGSSTIIRNMTYDFPLTLRKAQSPYSLDSTLTFYDELNIEAGVVIDQSGNSLVFRGVVSAIGESDDLIELKNGQISSKYAADITSEKNIFRYVKFINPAGIYVNGGLYDSCIFDGSLVPYNRALLKSGNGKMTLKNSTFIKWQGIAVEDSINASVFDNNTADVKYWLQQYNMMGSGTTGAISKGNTITVTETDLSPIFDIRVGDFLSMNDTINANSSKDIFSDTSTGSYASKITISNPSITGCKTAFTNTVTAGSIIKELYVTGGTVSGCSALASNRDHDDGVLEISGLTATGLDYGVSTGITLQLGLVSIDHSEIKVNKSLFHVGADKAAMKVTSSKIFCLDNTVDKCDIFSIGRAGMTPGTNIYFEFTNNDVSCDGDADSGCRGFYSNMDANGFAMSTDISGNFWNSGNKALNSTNFTTMLTSDSPLNTEIRGYHVGTANDHASWPWPPSVDPVPIVGALRTPVGPE